MNLDNPTIARLASLYPDFANRVVTVYGLIYDRFGLVMRCTDGRRTFEDQKKYYDQGRTTPGNVVTNDPPGDSLHEYGLAADSCFVGNDPYLDKHPNNEEIWRFFGQQCQLWEMKWGGFFKTVGRLHGDKPHAEKTYGLTLPLIKELYNESGLSGIWKAIDLSLKDKKTLIN